MGIEELGRQGHHSIDFSPEDGTIYDAAQQSKKEKGMEGEYQKRSSVRKSLEMFKKAEELIPGGRSF